MWLPLQSLHRNCMGQAKKEQHCFTSFNVAGASVSTRQNKKQNKEGVVAHAGSVSTQGAPAEQWELKVSLSYKARPEVLPWEHHKETAKMEGESGGWGVWGQPGQHNKAHVHGHAHRTKPPHLLDTPTRQVQDLGIKNQTLTSAWQPLYFESSPLLLDRKLHLFL